MLPNPTALAIQTASGQWRIHRCGALYPLTPQDRAEAQEIAAEMGPRLPIVPGYYDNPRFSAHPWHSPPTGWSPVPSSFYTFGSAHPRQVANFCGATEALLVEAAKRVPALLDAHISTAPQIFSQLLTEDLPERAPVIAQLLDMQNTAARALCGVGFSKDAMTYVFGVARANVSEWMVSGWPFCTIGY